MPPLCKDNTHQLLCSTLPLLAFSHTPGHFHLIATCGVAGDISVTSQPSGFLWHTQKTLQQDRVPRHNRGMWRRTSPSSGGSPTHHLLSSSLRQALPSDAVPCGWMGAEMMPEMLTHATTTRSPKNSPTSAFQPCVPPTPAEAHCIGTQFKPSGLCN